MRIDVRAGRLGDADAAADRPLGALNADAADPLHQPQGTGKMSMISPLPSVHRNWLGCTRRPGVALAHIAALTD
jgi:hypothetical protein